MTCFSLEKISPAPAPMPPAFKARMRAFARSLPAGLLLWAAVGQGATFPASGGDSVVGEVQAFTAKYQDTLLEIAEEFELGYEEVVAANPDLDSWLPGEGSRVVLPSRFIVPGKIDTGIYINLAEYRLYYFTGSNTVMTFPISIGRGDWDTPVGSAYVKAKVVEPAWYPPESIRREHAAEGDPLPRVVPPGPDNPLGKYALQLNLPGYLIHGTNRPYGIGMKATHGCIRLRPRNIATLFKLASIKTPVRIEWKPFKAGIKDGTIYFEAHPSGNEVEAILEGESAVDEEQRSAALTASIREVLKLADEAGIKAVDWSRLAEISEESLGIPLPISLATGGIADGTAAGMNVVQVQRQSTPGATHRQEAYLF